MFKKGFTLQELLITIGIIGIVAAIVAPGIVGMMPDQKKMMYMKAYNTLTTLTNEILDDPSLYWTTYDNDGEPNCSGLSCTTIPDEIQDVQGIQPADKFAYLLARRMNLSQDIRRPMGNNNDSIISFTTTDGIIWNIVTRIQNDNDLPGNRRAEVNLIIDLDDAENAPPECGNAMYSDNCKNPIRFRFLVDNDGGVSAMDALGQAYLQNPTDMHSASKDKEIADEILAENNNDAAEAEEEDVAN